MSTFASSSASFLAPAGAGPQGSNPRNREPLTHKQAGDLLRKAYDDFKQHYGRLKAAPEPHNPRDANLSGSLKDILSRNIAEGFPDCAAGWIAPEDILRTRLAFERELINHWNRNGRYDEGRDALHSGNGVFPLQAAIDKAGIDLTKREPVDEWEEAVEQPDVLRQDNAFQVAKQAQEANWSIGQSVFNFRPWGPADVPPAHAFHYQQYGHVPPAGWIGWTRADVLPNGRLPNGRKPAHPSWGPDTSIPYGYIEQPRVWPAAPVLPPAPVQHALRQRSGVAQLRPTPSGNIPFPNGNDGPLDVTVVELLIFFPRYLTSSDMIERLISNGGTVSLIKKILNRNLKLDFPIEGNYIHSLITPRMRHKEDQTANGGHNYLKWTVGAHLPLANHDPNNMNIAGLRARHDIEPVHFHRGEHTILFRDLAQHVQNMPTGDDALNLTRCVEWAVNHPGEDWMYPNDFRALVNHLSGFLPTIGVAFPVPVTNAHRDGEAWRRWK